MTRQAWDIDTVQVHLERITAKLTEWGFMVWRTKVRIFGATGWVIEIDTESNKEAVQAATREVFPNASFHSYIPISGKAPHKSRARFSITRGTAILGGDEFG